MEEVKPVAPVAATPPVTLPHARERIKKVPVKRTPEEIAALKAAAVERHKQTPPQKIAPAVAPVKFHGSYQEYLRTAGARKK